MRREEREISEKAEIENILEKARVCRLAFVDGDIPYIVPLNFGYKDDILYVHSAKQGRKIDLMKRNPRVCFEVDELVRFKKAKLACDWGVAYKSVIGTGKAGFIESGEEKKKALDIIMAHYSGRSFEYDNDILEKTTVIRIDIVQMTGKQV